MPESTQRRLAAIVSADVVGYSRLMQVDEAGTHARLRARYRDLVAPQIEKHGGRVVKLMGDGLLAEFPSVVNAAEWAVETQEAIAVANATEPPEHWITYRVGINLGDVIVDGEDLYGEGVNIAARLEAMAEPGGICISAKVHEEVRDRIDLAFDDLGEQEVKNIDRPVRVYRIRPGETAAELQEGPPRPRRSGNRWVLPALAVVVAVAVAVVAVVLLSSAPPPSVAITAPAPTAPTQPAIAVLPFDNLSGDPDQDYFSDGMTEDLITDLSQVSGLLVIARNSVFTYKGRAVKVQDVGRELGVQYVVEGSVRRAGNRVRINAQLVDAGNGHHLWAERFDRELTDVFALQDDVVKHIVEQLAVKLTRAEAAHLNRSTIVVPEAYDTLLRGLERLRRFTRENNAAAREFFERAAAIDPNYARAHADVALTYAMDVQFGWTETPDAHLRTALDHAERALALDASGRQVYFALGTVHLARRQYDDAITAARKSIELYPNYADGYAQLAENLNTVGETEASLEAIRKAMRLDPRHPFFYLWIVGKNYMLKERYDAAVTEFQKVLRQNPEFPGVHLMLAATYGLMGRIEDAEWEVEEIMTLLPEYNLTKARAQALFKRPEHLDRYLEGLRKAGLPE